MAKTKTVITDRQAIAAAKCVQRYLRGAAIRMPDVRKAQRVMQSFIRQQATRNRLTPAAAKKNFSLLKRSYAKEFMDLTKGL